MKIYLYLLFFLVCNYGASAQKEANTWYFATTVGIDFNSGGPVLLTNSAMSQYEGCSAISDKNTGDILIYSDGMNVYAGNHTLMPNGTGLTGQTSSAQSALIIPMPGNNMQYYVFTAGEYFSGGVGGYRYSIVDLTLNGGFGDVTAVKNVLLYAPACEKLCAVKNASGTGYWVATHEFTGNNFVLYEVTAAGVSPPLVVPCGTSYASTESIGCMKFSPDGTRLATVLSGQNMAEVYDFNSTTGAVTNPLTIGPVAGNLYVYGISFSPNSTLLYVGEENTNYLSQFDLSSGNAATITASKVIAGTSASYAFQSLQLAPDGKLYCAHNGSQYLAVVNSPDIYGIGCDYVDLGFYLGGFNCQYGLPGFTEELMQQNVMPIALFTAPHHVCPGTCTQFTNLSQNADTYQWLFPGAVPSNSTDTNPSNICYLTPGNYDVTLIATNSTGSDTTLLPNYITVYPYSPSQSILQSGDTLFSNTGFISYQWFFDGDTIPGATQSFYVATQNGNYSVVCFDDNGCSVEAVVLNVITSIQYTVDDQQPIMVYPNPVVDRFTIHNARFTIETATSISIYNMLGEKVFSAFDCLLSTVDCRLLTSGIYLLEITSDKKIYRTKFIKQ